MGFEGGNVAVVTVVPKVLCIGVDGADRNDTPWLSDGDGGVGEFGTTETAEVERELWPAAGSAVTKSKESGGGGMGGCDSGNVIPVRSMRRTCNSMSINFCSSA